MKKIVWLYGLIAGVLISINMVIMVRMIYTNPDFHGNAIVGYAAMIVVFSMVFFGVRSFRNKFQDGTITFGKALKVGTLIALVGSTVYVITWLISYYLFVPDFMDIYIQHATKEFAQSGASTSEIAEKSKQMAEMGEMYKNPVFVILFTYMEVFPVAFAIALISALVLKRKNLSPAMN